MSQEIASAFVRIRPNMTGFQSDVESGVRSGFSNIAKIVGVAFGAAEAFRFGEDIVSGAEALQKSVEVIKTDFGDASKAVVDFGEKGATSLGISAQTADATSARFGILFKNLGIGQKTAATMTVGFEQLAGSLSAIQGKDPSDVLQKIVLSAAGNTRGLKSLGIVVDATSEKVAAFKLGLTSSISQALTPAQKAEAIYAIATRNLGADLAQAALHSHDAANEQRQLSAEWANAKDALGAKLLPAVVAVVGFLANDLPTAISVTETAFGDLTADVKQFADFAAPVFKPVIDEIGRLHSAFSGGFGNGISQLKKDFGDLSNAGKGVILVVGGITAALVVMLAAAFPITATVLAVAGLAIGFQEAYQRSAQFRAVVGDIGDFLKSTVVPAFEGLAKAAAPAFAELYKLVKDLAGGFQEVIGAVNRVKSAFSGGFGSGLASIKKNFEDLSPAGKVAVGVILGVAAAIAILVASAFPITATVLAIAGIGIAFKEAYDHSATFRKVIADIGSFITGTFLPAVESILTKLSPVFNALGQLAKSAFGDVVEIVTSAVGTLKSVIEVTVGVIEAIWNAFGGTIEAVVKTAFGGLVQIVTDSLNIVKGIIDVVTGLVTGDWGKAWSGLKTIAKSGLDAVITTVTTWGKTLVLLFEGIWKQVEKVTLEGVKDALAPIAAIPTSFSVAGQKVGFANPAKAAQKQLQGLIDGLGGNKKDTKDRAAKAASDTQKSVLDGIKAGLGNFQDSAVPDAFGNSAKSALGPDGGKTGITKPLHDGIKAAVTAGIGTGTADGTTAGIAEAQQSLADMKDQLAASIAQNTLDIQNSVTSAKQNLASIGNDLASSIGAVLDQPLTKLQNSINKTQNLQTLNNLRRSAFLPGGKQLSADPDKALAQLKQLADKAGSVTKPAIEQFILQYQQAVLAVKQDQVNATKTSTTQRIADLTDSFNKGAITAKQLRTQLLALLQKDGVSYKKAGELLGVSFADGFKAQVQGISKQADAIAAGPKLAGTGQEPSITQPLLVVQKDARDIAKQQLAIAKAGTALQTRIAKASESTAVTVAALKGTDVNPNALGKNPGTKGKTAKALVGTGN